MKRVSKLYLIIIFVTLLILSISTVFFAKESQKDKFQELRHYIIADFRKFLIYENENLLSFSMALSENGALKNALMADDSQKAYEILSRISEKFKQYTTIKRLRIQIFDNDLFIFAQSWGNSSVGMPIWWFRNDLNRFKYDKRPKVGIETGRMLTFKATVAIENGKEYIGYLEVIKFMDEFTQKLRQKGIELFVLMDSKYSKKASLMSEYPFLNRYIISNQNFNIKLKKRAEYIDWRELDNLGYLYKDKILYILEPMYNGKREEIGKYLIILPKTTLDFYQKNYQDISFFTRLRDDDVYNIVKLWENPYGGYRDIDDKNLIELLPRLHQKDRKNMTKRATDILNSYSKDELINIILDGNYRAKKVGKIR
jgi:hypothetical protein